MNHKEESQKLNEVFSLIQEHLSEAQVQCLKDEYEKLAMKKSQERILELEKTMERIIKLARGDKRFLPAIIFKIETVAFYALRQPKRPKPC